ncbi:T9SS type A sorting domain-containing protein [Winogradskyella flava]|uniref:T9SS type A sorting domain-containing protein n=1 Tax=Winogradskyella flava TaxID=1884876 RepID=UPI002490EFC1|nr:T9SS type A sorting domain-containing protein [Winogradskyella flava]
MTSKSLFRCFACAIGLLCTNNLSSQNLLSGYPWTTGTGSVIGYNHIGSASHNIREYDYDHVNDNALVWRVVSNESGLTNGGWTGYQIPIDNNKSYRFSLWIKRMDSNEGQDRFGWNDNGNFRILNLDGSQATHAYFWYGNLPITNRWYLLVGYIHKKDYTSQTHLGKIYDGVTGQAVLDITDYKFKNTATSIGLQARIYSNTDPLVGIQFHKPRIDVVNGEEPPINHLLNINTDTELIFAYDYAGNQKQRFYCGEANCEIPEPPAGRPGIDQNENVSEAITQEPSLENGIFISPNPTSGKFTIKLSNTDFNINGTVNIYNSSGSLLEHMDIKQPAKTIEVDLGDAPTGIYFVHLHTDDGNSTTKKIIKN